MKHLGWLWLLAACAKGPSVGTERGACRPDRGCDQGLQCLSQLCVETPEVPPEVVERWADETCACRDGGCARSRVERFTQEDRSADRRPVTAEERKRTEVARARIKECVAKVASVTPAALPAPQIGIASCDRFLRHYVRCVQDMPVAARGPAMDGLEQMVDAWREAAGMGEGARAALETGCASADANSREAMKAACPDAGWDEP